MATTGPVNVRHFMTAKAKIVPIKTSTNQRTVPKEIENKTLQCKENWDEVEIPSLDKQEGEVEIPSEIRSGEE